MGASAGKVAVEIHRASAPPQILLFPGWDGFLLVVLFV